MTPLKLEIPESTTPTILCLGAHSDDIEIGALATILGLKERYPEARIIWAVFCAPDNRLAEARGSAARCCAGFRMSDIRIRNYRDGFFPAQLTQIKEEFEVIKSAESPSIVFTHYKHDAHQDHRTISELTWQTFRNHLILEYEIPKYDGDLGSPNVFFPITIEARNEKLEVLNHFFLSQKEKMWFSSDVFAGVMRLRGMQCNSPSGSAEAFYCSKLLIE